MDWKKYCAGLAALSLGIALTGSAVAPSYGHRPDTTSWSGVLHIPGSAQVSSNLLTEEGQTILLRPEDEAVSITLNSRFGMVSGRLEVANGTYLTGVLEQTELTVQEGTEQRVGLNLKIDKEITEEFTDILRVTWTPNDGGSQLFGDVTVKLVPKTPPEETPPEATKPEATQPEETPPEATKPEATQPEETQPEETPPEATQPEETQPEETGPEETPPEETEPERNTGMAAPLPGDPLTGYTTVTTPDMPLVLVLQETIDTALLSWNGEAFPELTRYCQNGHWSVLASPDYIQLSLNEGSEILLALPAGQKKENTLTVTANWSSLSMEQDVSVACFEEAAPESGGTPRILTEKAPLEIPAQTTWDAYGVQTGREGYELQTSLFRLDGTGETLQWTAFPLEKEEKNLADKEGLIIKDSENGCQLSVAEGKRPPAGTYRLRQVWLINQTQTVRQVDTVFYISYSAMEVNGGTVQ